MNSFTFNSNRERSFPKQFSDFPTPRAASVGCLKVPRHVAPTLHGTDGPDTVADDAVAQMRRLRRVRRRVSDSASSRAQAGSTRRTCSAHRRRDARLPAGHRRSLAPPPRRLRRGPAQLPACRAAPPPLPRRGLAVRAKHDAPALGACQRPRRRLSTDFSVASPSNDALPTSCEAATPY